MERALGRALIECMAAAGFPDAVAFDDDWSPSGDGAVVDGGLYGWADASSPPMLDELGPVWLPEPLSEQAAEALFGTEDDGSLFGPGCIGETMTAVLGDTEAWVQLEELLVGLDESMASDPRVVAAQGEWRDCMQTRGFGGFSGPDEVWASIVDELESLAGPIMILDEDEGDVPPESDWIEDPPGPDPDTLAEARAHADAVMAAAGDCQAVHLEAVAEAVYAEKLEELARDHAEVFRRAGLTP